MNYHNVYLPLLDVYEAGGPGTFTSLTRKSGNEKNLLILTFNMLNQLRGRSDSGSQSAYDIGEFMRSQLTEKFSFNKDEKLNGFHLDNGLDVVILPKKYVGEGTYLSRKGSFIQQKVTELIDNGKQYKIDFLTTNNFDATILENEGLRHSKPAFLMANAEVVKKGIIKPNNEFISQMYSCQDKYLPIEKANKYFDEELYLNQFIDLGKNNYVKVTGDIIRNNSFIKGVDQMRVQHLASFEQKMKLKVGDYYMKNVLGITPKDIQQYLALQYCLFDPNVTTSFITGGQGSGKTLLAYAAAIDMMLQYNKDEKIQRIRGRFSTAKNGFFDRLVLIKPLTLVGDDQLGFLPGSLEEKLSPYLEPFRDAHKETSLPQMGYGTFESLFSSSELTEQDNSGSKKGPSRNFPKEFPAHPPREGSMEVVFYGMSRGRSLHNTLMVIDEAQNLKPYMMKTLIERMALGSKLVILGDPYQVDAKSGCTPDMNGLTHAYKHLITKPFTAAVHLTNHYRSHDSKAVRDWKVYS